MVTVGTKDNRAVLIRTEGFYLHLLIPFHYVSVRMPEAVPRTDTVDSIHGMNGMDKFL